MGIITKTVKVGIGGKNFRHYRELGYDFDRIGDKIEVKVEHLTNGSNVLVEAKCDYCGKVRTIAYEHYNYCLDSNGWYACKDCVRHKVVETNLKRYGVTSTAKLTEVKEKMYKTNIQKYGGIAPCCSSEIREKVAKTLFKNSTISTSKQQLYIYNLYNIDEQAELNYPISYYNADICFPNEKLVIETDFGGHDLCVKLGKVPQEDFDRRQIIRSRTIKKEGYKQIRIISINDKLPSDFVLMQMFEFAKNFLFTTTHSWVIFDISNSKMMNATNKDTNGVYYDYGVLRAIKDSDLPPSIIKKAKYNLRKVV